MVSKEKVRENAYAMEEEREWMKRRTRKSGGRKRENVYDGTMCSMKNKLLNINY